MKIADFEKAKPLVKQYWLLGEYIHDAGTDTRLGVNIGGRYDDVLRNAARPAVIGELKRQRDVVLADLRLLGIEE